MSDDIVQLMTQSMDSPAPASQDSTAAMTSAMAGPSPEQQQSSEPASFVDRLAAMTGSPAMAFAAGMTGKEGTEQAAAANRGIAQKVREAGQEGAKVGASSFDIF